MEDDDDDDDYDDDDLRLPESETGVPLDHCEASLVCYIDSTAFLFEK